MRWTALAAMALAASSAHAQWQILDGHTTADLRGIDNVGGGVAWASGTNGTVLRTEDAGFVWQLCAVPPGAEKLDFRGVQAFDNNTAIVMSSGPGDLSRLYKTTDGCQTWKLVFTNPDKDGFWDAIVLEKKRNGRERTGVLVGDPVASEQTVFLSADGGSSWQRWREGNDAPGTHCKEKAAVAEPGEGLFAASNSAAFEFFGANFAMVTGGVSGPKLVYMDGGDSDGMLPCRIKLTAVPLPLVKGESAGAFSMAATTALSYFPIEAMVVGGDYSKPDATSGNAIFLSTKRGDPFSGQSVFKSISPRVPPHGYRSAVTYDASSKTWITVGPNGTDVSTDDGRNWRALKPGPGEPPDADQHWNALSLPYVVGPHGRIGVLREDALQSPKASVQKK